MADRWRYAGGIGVTGVLFALIHLGGIYVVTAFAAVDPSPGGAADDPRFGLLFVIALLVGTGLMLAAFRWNLDWIVRGLVLFVTFGLSVLVLDIILPPVLVIGGIPVVPVVIGAGFVGLLAIYPEWYVLNAVGVLVGAGAVGLLGMTLGIRTAVILLVLLAVYDLISVYGTKHMLTLAEGAMRGRLPVVLVIPLSLSFSILSNDEDDESFAPDGALVIGLGDAVIPGLLATSAALYGPVEPTMIAGLSLSAPVGGVIVGTLVGLIALFVIPESGKPHPGLPFLAGGAIGGYLVGSALVGVSPVDALSVIIIE